MVSWVHPSHPKGISIGSTFSQGSRKWPTHTHTDRPRYSVCSNRSLSLAIEAMRPKNETSAPMHLQATKTSNVGRCLTVVLTSCNGCLTVNHFSKEYNVVCQVSGAFARRQHQIPTGPVRVGDTSVLPVRTVRDLGVLTSRQSSERVLQHSVKYAACGVLWHVHLRGGSAVSSPSGVRDGAPAEIEFGAL